MLELKFSHYIIYFSAIKKIIYYFNNPSLVYGTIAQRKKREPRLKGLCNSQTKITILNMAICDPAFLNESDGY